MFGINNGQPVEFNELEDIMPGAGYFFLCKINEFLIISSTFRSIC